MDAFQERQDGPYSVSRGRKESGNFLLTHVEWHPCHSECDIGQPETGVRYKQPDGTFGDFRLIQHGWWNFDDAEAVILKALNKGWDIYRIDNLMEFIRERKRRARFI